MTYIARLIWVALWIAIFFLLAGFALQNIDEVTVKYAFLFQWQLPLVAVIFVAMVIGALLGVLAMLKPWFRLRRQIQRLKKELKGSAQAGAAPALAQSALVGSPSVTDKP
jgi:uncharacterized integral membrane protein